ncbi:MAG: hypothetical protein ACM31P_10495 [Actinomycetota bacterium]
MPLHRFSPAQKVLFVSAAALSIAWFTRIDWALAFSKGELINALSSYVGAVAIALLPLLALWRLIQTASRSPLFQMLSVAFVVLIAVGGYAYLWSSSIPSGGWELFIVLFAQAMAITCLYLTTKIKNHASTKSEI